MCDGPDGDDYEAFRFFTERDVRARKVHVCECCQGEIAAGEVYRRSSAGWDGTVISEAMCSACGAAYDAYKAAHNWSTMPSGLDTLIEQCVYEEREEAKHRGDEGAAMRAAYWEQHLDNMKARAAARVAAKGV